MALGNYTDVYDVSAFEDRVIDIGMGIKSEKNNANFLIRTKLKNEIKNLKDKERKIFKILNVNNIKELNERIEEYKKTTINLMGINLKEKIVQFLEEDNSEKAALESAAILEYIDKKILSNMGNGSLMDKIEQNGIEKIIGEVFKILNVGKSHFRNKSAYTNEGIFTSELTTHQRERFKNLITELFQEEGFSQKDFPAISAYKSNNGNSSTVVITWNTFTKGLTPTDAKEIYKNDRTGLNEINNKIVKYIISFIPNKNDQNLIEQLIWKKVLNVNEYAFFVGKNSKDVVGILGEIQGLFYINKLLLGSEKNAKKINNLFWRGGTHDGNLGKKPHQDIVLAGIGIQVKNTTQKSIEEMHAVGFTELGIEDFLKRAEVSPAVINLFKHYYGTLNFNVPYHYDPTEKEGERYKDGLWKTKNSDTYKIDRYVLESYQTDIDKLLSIYASTLMYLDTQKAIGKDANTLFLIGGTAFYTASQILEEIISKLQSEEKSRFSVSSNFKKDNKNNIITALNNGKKKGTNFSGKVISNIILSSSYKF